MRTLDPRLAADTHVMGFFGDTQVLLLRNAHYPWLVLVPDTDETEFHRLPLAAQSELMALASRLAVFIENWQPLDKVNIAAIGNVVSQMHLHVVGRRCDDPCWPGVVWGAEPFKAYEAEALDTLRSRLVAEVGEDYRPIAQLDLKKAT